MIGLKNNCKTRRFEAGVIAAGYSSAGNNAARDLRLVSILNKERGGPCGMGIPKEMVRAGWRSQLCSVPVLYSL